MHLVRGACPFYFPSIKIMLYNIYMNNKNILKIIRYSMSFIFLWAFLDKTFGFGFATSADKAWISGGSPTTGFLLNGTYGPFGSFFQSLANSNFVDWIFMLGLLFVGLSLLFKKYLKWGAVTGIILMLLMYLSAFPPKNNPIIDDHIIYILILALLVFESKNS